MAALVILGIAGTYGVVMGQPSLRLPVPVHPRPPPHTTTTLDALSVPVPDSSSCDWEQVSFTADAMVEIGRTSHASQLDISLDSGDSYSLHFFAGEELRGELETGTVPVPCQGHGMARFSTELPAQVTEAGFDRFAISAQGDEVYCIGDLVLTE